MASCSRSWGSWPSRSRSSPRRRLSSAARTAAASLCQFLTEPGLLQVGAPLSCARRCYDAGRAREASRGLTGRRHRVRSVFEARRQRGRARRRKHIHDRLREALPPEFSTFQNVARVVRDHGVEREGEADVIVAHPERGFLIIEVKSGPITRDGQGGWAGGRPSIAPFEQASDSRHSLVAKLRELPDWPPASTRCPAMPSRSQMPKSPASAPRSSSSGPTPTRT